LFGEKEKRMPQSDPSQLAPLLEQSRSGDAGALNTLLGRLRPYLQALVRSWWGHDLSSRLGDSDVVQEVLLQASCHFKDFRGEQVPQLLAWLKTIAYRAADDRKRKLLADAGQAEALPADVPSPEMGPTDVLEEEEDAVRLAAALQRLNQRRQDVVQLRLLDGLDFPEIARRLGGSPGALRVLFFRAIGQLHLLLETEP
jgi:RNA polymerase sigma-70 factor, ECF subfamily